MAKSVSHPISTRDSNETPITALGLTRKKTTVIANYSSTKRILLISLSGAIVQNVSIFFLLYLIIRVTLSVAVANCHTM